MITLIRYCLIPRYTKSRSRSALSSWVWKREADLEKWAIYLEKLNFGGRGEKTKMGIDEKQQTIRTIRKWNRGIGTPYYSSDVTDERRESIVVGGVGWCDWLCWFCSFFITRVFVISILLLFYFIMIFFLLDPKVRSNKLMYPKIALANSPTICQGLIIAIVFWRKMYLTRLKTLETWKKISFHYNLAKWIKGEP